MLFNDCKVGYCSECGKETKQKIIESRGMFKGAQRVFLGIMTIGMSEVPNSMTKEYKCECTKCGHINTLRD